MGERAAILGTRGRNRARPPVEPATLEAVRLPVMPPVAPMLAKTVAAIPAGRHYEPKWDGFRAIVFRDGDEVEILSRNARPLARYFPDVVEAVKSNLPPRCVVDGELVIADPQTRRLDFWALQQRLHPAATRVRRLATETPASLIAFDLLALGDADYTPRPFRERRAALEAALAPASPPVHLTPITRDEQRAQRWFESFEGAGLDGLIAKDGEQVYRPGERVMFKIKHQRTADCVVAGYRLHKSGPDALGSLLLALYDDDASPATEWSGMFGGLLPIGAAAAFTMARRRELLAELQPLVDRHRRPSLGHQRARGGRRARATGGIPAGTGRSSRWRRSGSSRCATATWTAAGSATPRRSCAGAPTATPASCGYAQLERPARFDLADVLRG